MWLKRIMCLLFLHQSEVCANSSYIDNHPSWKYMSRTTCGKTRYDNVQERIIEGKKASLGQFPWMVRIGYAKVTLLEPEFVCGGSLISTLHVLTAGHCSTKNNIVRVGENNVKTGFDCGEGVCAPLPQDVWIEKHLLNVYVQSTNKDDINLIKLRKAVTLHEFVVPICLPYGKLLQEDMMGKQVSIAGWGYTNSSSATQSEDLMHVSAPVVNQSLCNDLYRNPLTENQLCIGYPEGKDSCNGDSGGPVIHSVKVGKVRRMYQCGIVSYGLKECGTGPAVYTAVAKYMKLILDNMLCSE